MSACYRAPEPTAPWRVQNSVCQRDSYVRLVLDSDETHRCRAGPSHGCTGSEPQQLHRYKLQYCNITETPLYSSNKLRSHGDT